MRGMWIKTFNDGTQERGSDMDIAAGRASWSQGKLTDIKEVMLTEGTRMICMQIDDTEWHQFDKMIVPVAPGTHTPSRTHRVLQAKINSKHVGLKIKMMTSPMISICSLSEDGTGLQISKSNVGLWLTLVVPARETPYVVIASYGQIKERDK